MSHARTICQEAHELLLAREEVYGDMVDSWRRIAEEVSRRTGDYVSAETALWVPSSARGARRPAPGVGEGERRRELILLANPCQSP